TCIHTNPTRFTQLPLITSTTTVTVALLQLINPLPSLFFFNATPTTVTYTLSLHDALPIYIQHQLAHLRLCARGLLAGHPGKVAGSEEHTSELQSLAYLVCRLLLEKKKNCTSWGAREVCQRARFGTVSPRVQIPIPRPNIPYLNSPQEM